MIFPKLREISFKAEMFKHRTDWLTEQSEQFL